MEELVERAKKGDKSAFTELTLEIKNDLYKLARTRLHQNDDVEEVVQETMVKAFQQIQQLKDPTKFKPWVSRILINKCYRKYTKIKKENELYQVLDEFNYIPEDDQMDRVENTIDFYNIIKNLTYEEREIIELHYGIGHTFKEIANILHMNENTVKTKVLRAKEKIRINNEGGVKHG